jgi:hypothetical protein
MKKWDNGKMRQFADKAHLSVLDYPITSLSNYPIKNAPVGEPAKPPRFQRGDYGFETRREYK